MTAAGTQGPLRVVFAGTPDFAVPSLDALAGQDQVRVVGVYTQPDRRAGRGRRLRPGAIKSRALELDLAVEQPASLRRAAAVAALRELRPDLIVVVAYGLILPPGVLALPRLGCINVHASLLPRWRGAAPVQRAILAGDAETGVTIMQMDAGLDTGAMLLRRATPIGSDETAGELGERLSRLGASALSEALPLIAAGTAVGEAQDEALATYADKISKAEARLDWTRPAAELARRVRAFNPWPGAETRLGEGQLRVWRAEALDAGHGARPGSVLAARDTFDVATGEGVLRLLRVQTAGRRAMDAADFLRGRRLAGEVLDGASR